MITWTELLKYHHHPPNPSIPRTDQMEQHYQEFRRNQPEMISTLRHRFFQSCSIVLVLSDFPYDLASNIRHYILWISNNDVYTPQQIEAFIIQRYRTAIPRVNMVCYQNVINRRTINEIQHYHVFIRE